MSEDLIKREDAIKAVSKVDDYGDGIGFEVRSHCLVELELVPSADRPQEWIPCSERLPEVSKMVYEGSKWMQPIGFADYFLLSDWVLVTADADSSDGDDTEIFVAQYEDDLDGRTYWTTIGAELLNNVTAWMPLPKPWKGADDE